MLGGRAEKRGKETRVEEVKGMFFFHMYEKNGRERWMVKEVIKQETKE